MVLTLFGMSVLIFVMLRLVPGNIADILFDCGRHRRSRRRRRRSDASSVSTSRSSSSTASGSAACRAATSALPMSRSSRRIDEIAPRIPISAKLAGMALFFAVMVGVPLGVISAVRQNTPLDYFLRVLSLSGLSLPSFWLGLLVLMAFVHWFGTIPIYSSTADASGRSSALLAIPAAAVGFRSSALIMRLTRSSMLEVLRQDYIRTARSKGASTTSVNYDHALRNALLPVITIIGIEAAFLVGGLIVTETVFNIPGVARFLVEAIRWRDYPIVQNLVMFIAFVVVTVNFLVDMAYMALDPRIKYAD